jgi:hypothetical protein
MIQDSYSGDRQPLFAHTHVTFVGQALGLILAKSPEAAQAGARKVHVTYGPPPVSSSSKDTASSINDSSSSSSSKEGIAAGGADGGLDGMSATAAAGVDGGSCSALTSLSAAVAVESWFEMGKFPGADKASTGEHALPVLHRLSTVLRNTVHGWMSFAIPCDVRQLKPCLYACSQPVTCLDRVYVHPVEHTQSFVS